MDDATEDGTVILGDVPDHGWCEICMDASEDGRMWVRVDSPEEIIEYPYSWVPVPV